MIYDITNLVMMPFYLLPDEDLCLIALKTLFAIHLWAFIKVICTQEGIQG
jgi:hypothetical protein